MQLIVCGFSTKSCNFCPFRELHHRRRSWNCFLPGCRSDQKSGGSGHGCVIPKVVWPKACIKNGRMLISLSCLHVMLVNTLCSLLQDILCKFDLSRHFLFLFNSTTSGMFNVRPLGKQLCKLWLETLSFCFYFVISVTSVDGLIWCLVETCFYGHVVAISTI